MLDAAALGLQALADIERGAANIAALVAKGAAEGARLLATAADAAQGAAAALGATASRDKAAAASARAEAASLDAAYTKELASKATAAIKAAGKKIAKAAATIGKTVAKAAVVVAKAAYKYSGAQSVVSCVTDPHLSSCIQAAVTIALVVGTGGGGEIADVAAEGAIDAAEGAGSAVAEDGLAQAREVAELAAKQTESKEAISEAAHGSENVGGALDDGLAASRPPATLSTSQPPLGSNPVATAQGPTAAVHDPYSTIFLAGAMIMKAIAVGIKYFVGRG